MKVRMLVSMAGGVTLAPGDEHHCDAEEAKRLIDAGFAEAMSSAPVKETAVARQPRKERRG